MAKSSVAHATTNSSKGKSIENLERQTYRLLKTKETYFEWWNSVKEVGRDFDKLKQLIFIE